MQITLSNFRDAAHCEAMIQVLEDFAEDPSLNGIARNELKELHDATVARMQQLGEADD
ncbi:MAG: hypothetical protein U5O39_19945 [Gammaproteobacteria bacterium]|nr:hypothetical protein [Gammaproteobacteria bacterium]